MNLDIIVRTHDKDNVHNFQERYCGVNKQTVVLKCVSSLANSAKLISNTNISFTILDDRSSSETLQQLDSIFSANKHQYKIINLVNDTDMRVYNYTALKQWEACRDSNADLVYSVEDDYLHCPTALSEMIESYKIFVGGFGTKDICINPYDFPDQYSELKPPEEAICQVGYGSHRHWRTTFRTTNTFMTTPDVFRKYWEAFYILATEYNSDHSINKVDEYNTINQVWSNYVPTLSPISSLALHMQFLEQKDRYIDWEYWWEHYTE